MIGRRSATGSIDATAQSIDEAPHWQGEGETVWVSPDDQGSETVDGVPALEPEPERDRQSTLEDWGGGIDVRGD